MQHFCHQNNVYTAFLVMFQWCWTLYDCMISLMYNVQLRSEPQSSRLKGACWLSFFPSIYSLYLSCCAARSRPIVYLINGTYYFTSFFLNFRTDDWVAFLRTVVKHTGVRQPVFKQHSAAHSHSHSISGCKHLQEISVTILTIIHPALVIISVFLRVCFLLQLRLAQRCSVGFICGKSGKTFFFLKCCLCYT